MFRSGYWDVEYWNFVVLGERDVESVCEECKICTSAAEQVAEKRRIEASRAKAPRRKGATYGGAEAPPFPFSASCEAALILLRLCRS